jgi:hypothetical protein
MGLYGFVWFGTREIAREICNSKIYKISCTSFSRIQDCQYENYVTTHFINITVYVIQILFPVPLFGYIFILFFNLIFYLRLFLIFF